MDESNDFGDGVGSLSSFLCLSNCLSVCMSEKRSNESGSTRIFGISPRWQVCEEGQRGARFAQFGLHASSEWQRQHKLHTNCLPTEKEAAVFIPIAYLSSAARTGAEASPGIFWQSCAVRNVLKFIEYRIQERNTIEGILG